MKKNILKKVVASVATVAMAVGMFTAMPAQETKAAVSGDGKVYMVGTIDNSWDPATAPEMTSSDGATFTYTYSVDAAGSGEFKLLVGDNTGWNGQDRGYMGDGSIEFSNIEDNGGNMKVSYSQAGNVTITAVFDGDTLKSVKAEGTAVGTYTLPDEYYVVGAKELTGVNWGDDNFAGVEANQLKVTDNADVYSLTLKGVEKGSYEFKIIQTLSWDKSWPSGMGNHTAEVPEKSDVTITFNKSTGEINVTYKSVATGEEQTQKIAEATIKAEDTTTTTTTGSNTSTKTGDAAPVIAMLAVAALAGAVVVASRKKTVSE